jgi:prepilin-type N-terminal cleavage/methylation domain-containing protein
MRTAARHAKQAFTLIELLVVISIIAILAAALLPVLSIMSTRAKVKRAQLEIAGIVNAIQQYESTYSHFPVSREAINDASRPSGQPEDFTYGTEGLTCAGSTYNDGFKTPTGTLRVQATTGDSPPKPFTYQTNNAEVMAVLLDLEFYGDGRPTINQGHVKNAQRTKFLDPSFASDTSSPGVGKDGVYRDPWGNPYIISIDLDNDGKTRDGFYRQSSVSKQNGQTGYYGLFDPADIAGNQNYFEHHGPVMVWSAGPDRKIELTKAALGANRDNILSWKP